MGLVCTVSAKQHLSSEDYGWAYVGTHKYVFQKLTIEQSEK